MITASPTRHYPVAPDALAALNNRARRSILRIVHRDDAAHQLPDDALADFLHQLRIEADTEGALHARLHPDVPCTDGTIRDVVEQRTFPSAGSFDIAFTLEGLDD